MDLTKANNLKCILAELMVGTLTDSARLCRKLHVKMKCGSGDELIRKSSQQLDAVEY